MKRLEPVTRWADLSDDRRFRYELRRVWRPGPMLPAVLLNPSVAGEAIDDATVRWFRGYTARHGFGGLCLANVFPFVQTHLAADELGALSLDTGRHLMGLVDVVNFAKQGRGFVLCGWGDGIRKIPNQALWLSFVLTIASAHGVELRALGTTALGNPWHPLRKSHSLEAKPWEPVR